MDQDSHADRHDRDKLERWWHDLIAEKGSHPTLHAVFLVTEKDRHAHDAFRRFREVYDGLSAPFHSLVIFGQHGGSITSRVLAQGFGVPDVGIPGLVLFESHQDSRVAMIPLGPPGEGGVADDVLGRLLQGCSAGAALGQVVAGLERANVALMRHSCIEDLVRATLTEVGEKGRNG